MRVTVRPITGTPRRPPDNRRRGDLDHRIDIKDGYEINEFVKEFNVMAQKLGDRARRDETHEQEAYRAFRCRRPDAGLHLTVIFTRALTRRCTAP